MATITSSPSFTIITIITHITLNGQVATSL
jgi:hypothetical protein